MTGGGKVTVEPLEFHLGLVTDSKGRACSDEAYITVGSDHGQEPTDHEINIHGPRANEIAALIAEAGTIYSETGFTPRQLADERGKLWAAAEQALYAIDTVLSSHVGQAEYEELAAAFNALEAALTSSGRAPDDAPSAALRDIAAERRRQIESEGWTHEHDDEHAPGELAQAGACYAQNLGRDDFPPKEWPWSNDWWKPGPLRRDLVRAGALIVAELERHDRQASGRAPEGEQDKSS